MELQNVKRRMTTRQQKGQKSISKLDYLNLET